jgi:outer membrane autotransporter protein
MSYGGQAEFGVRLGSNPLHAEPIASLSYVRTDLRDLRALGSTIDFDGLDGLRAKLGLRVGGTVKMGESLAAGLYAQGNYVHEFEGRDGIHFLTGGQSFGYRNRPIGDYAEGKLGITIAGPGGVAGFVEGFGDYSNSYRGGGGRVGLRVNL